MNVSTQAMQLSDFKEQIKMEFKPRKHKHFSKGSKIGNKLLTRIRLDRSDLNSHKFTIGHSESAECSCQAKNETSLHYLIECFQSLPDNFLFSKPPQFQPLLKYWGHLKNFYSNTTNYGVDGKNLPSTPQIVVSIAKILLQHHKMWCRS